MFAIQKYAD